MLRYVMQVRWIPWHLLCALIFAALTALGAWQMYVAFNPGILEPSGFSIRNFVYSLQWFVFALFSVWFWYRYIRDQRDSELAIQSENDAIERARDALTEGGEAPAQESPRDNSPRVPEISLDAPADERRRQLFGDESRPDDTPNDDLDSGSKE